MTRIRESSKFWKSYHEAAYDPVELKRKIDQFIEWKANGVLPTPPFSADKPSLYNRKNELIKPYQKANLWHCHLDIANKDPMVVYRPHPAQKAILLVCIVDHDEMFERKKDFIRKYGKTFSEDWEL